MLMLIVTETEKKDNFAINNMGDFPSSIANTDILERILKPELLAINGLF